MGKTAKHQRFPVILAIMMSLNYLLADTASAFHSGGVGDCSGCHSMHNSAQVEEGNQLFLVSPDPSSTCLTCHLKAGEKAPFDYHVATDDSDMTDGFPPAQMTPGGDFGWLKKNYRWDSEGEVAGDQSPGERHGHNIIASAYGFVADSTFATAPGGTYPAAGLSCTSCHDPHGRYRRFSDGRIGKTGLPVQSSGSYETSPDPTGHAAVGVYRMLGGKGYTSRFGGDTPFSQDPPTAVSPRGFNRAETDTDTRVAYGRNMSEWCMNCHNTIGGSSNGSGHPAGNIVRMSSLVAANYNSYIASGKATGSSSTSYTSMVPFETGSSDYALLKRTASNDGSMTAGPDTGSNVMCLTCHRAHASAWDKAIRWNVKSIFLVYNGDYTGVDRTDVPAQYSQGRTKVETRRAFHERPAGAYSTYQRSLCNKCHTMD